MTQQNAFIIKFATEEWEFDQIHRLNYKTFTEEIPQHESNVDKLLIDKFHLQNRYLICLLKRKLVGMVTFRDQRPFSLDLKLPRLETYLPPFKSICEIRLFAIEKDYRGTSVFFLLLDEFDKYWQEKKYDLFVISGTTRQLRLYRHLGLITFGPLVGSGDVMFQPMFWTRDGFIDSLAFRRLKGK